MIWRKRRRRRMEKNTDRANPKKIVNPRTPCPDGATESMYQGCAVS